MILGMITKFLPNLIPAIGSFLNPWVWVVILAVSSGSFLYSTHLGNERLDAYKEAADQVDQARKTVVKYVVVQQKVIDQEVTDEYKRKNATLTRDNLTLYNSLSKHVQAGINLSRPGVSEAAGELVEGVTDRFDRAKLIGGLRGTIQRFLDGYEQSLERGDRARVLLQSCIDFTERQHSLTSGAAK